MSDNKIDMYTEDLPDGTAKRAAIYYDRLINYRFRVCNAWFV